MYSIKEKIEIIDENINDMENMIYQVTVIKLCEVFT